MFLKKLKKFLKKNDSNISLIIGLVIIVIVGLFIINNYDSTKDGEIIPSIGTESELGLGERHIVKKGEDLWKIALNYYESGYDWIKIAEANKIKAPYSIETGQELIIPAIEKATPVPEKEEISPTAKPTEVAPISVETSIGSDKYTVIKGDSLWSIALRSYGDGYKWVNIAKANDLKNPGLIHPGNEFVIPR